MLNKNRKEIKNRIFPFIFKKTFFENFMHMSWSCPSSVPSLQLSFSPSQFYAHFISFIFNQSPVSAVHMHMGMDSFTEVWETYQWPPLQRMWLFLPQNQLAIAPHRGVGTWEALLLQAGWILILINININCLDIVQETTAAASCVQQPQHAQRTAFHSSPPILGLLHSLCPLCLHTPWVFQLTPYTHCPQCSWPC